MGLQFVPEGPKHLEASVSTSLFESRLLHLPVITQEASGGCQEELGQIVEVVRFDRAMAGITRLSELANAQEPELHDLQHDPRGISRRVHRSLPHREPQDRRTRTWNALRHHENIDMESEFPSDLDGMVPIPDHPFLCDVDWRRSLHHTGVSLLCQPAVSVNRALMTALSVEWIGRFNARAVATGAARATLFRIQF